MATKRHKKGSARRAEERALRQAARTHKPVAVRNAQGKVVQQVVARKPSGQFIKAKAVRVRKVGRRLVVDIKR